MIIVIDGPSGSGKSSTAKAVAQTLGIQYLDSGALYRAVTCLYIDYDGPENEFLDFLLSQNLRFHFENGVFHVIADSGDLTGRIRTTAVAERVSDIASRVEIRQFVNRLMRQAVRDGRYIADGRDLGTAVFPDAEIKIYMDASLDTRARRRFKELLDEGESVTLRQVKANLAERDRKDSGREADPLKKADDAVVIDTSGKSFEQQVQEICSLIREQYSNI